MAQASVTRADDRLLVMVVDDDPTISEIVASYLERAGFDVVTADDGDRAVEIAALRRPDLLVLDLMLPGRSGLEVCRTVRASRPELPVIMLTALGEEDDRIAGLEHGADDYMVKPFSPRELVLRVQSVLRRTAAPPTGDGRRSRWAARGLEIDVPARLAALDGRELSLTGREFDLLAHLVARPGEAFTRRQLMTEVWGWEFGDDSTVTVHVRRLREKIEDDPSAPRRLMTVWGVGYRWQAP